MATRNIVPRATGEGSIGTSAKTWNAVYTENLSVTNEIQGIVEKATNDKNGNDITETYLPFSGGNITGDFSVNSNVVESVNSSGTNYIRYDSGVQICWGYVAASSSGTTVTFPLPFVSNPRVVVSNAQINTHASYGSLSPTSVSLYNNSTNSSQVSYIAVGKWK